MAGFFSNTPTIAITPPAGDSTDHAPLTYTAEYHNSSNEVYASIDAAFENPRKVRRRRSVSGKDDFFKDMPSKG